MDGSGEVNTIRQTSLEEVRTFVSLQNFTSPKYVTAMKVLTADKPF